MSKVSILFFTVIGNVLIAQSSLTEIKRNIYQDLNSSVNQNYVRLINEAKTKDVQNEFYAFSEWVEFEVLSKDGDTIFLDSANYHIYNDMMLFLSEGKLYYLYPEEANKISVQDKTYTAYRSDEKESGYYELLVDGAIQLLKKYKVSKEKIVNHPMGITHGQSDYKYRIKSEFYYNDTLKNKVNHVPRKKKNLMKIFSRKRNRMIAFAKENKLNNKSEEHLVKLFSYYNQLD